MRLATAGMLGLLLGTSVHASDLVTRSGKTFHNYRVVSHDAGFVILMDHDGGSRIPLADLPTDLQRQYGYDPVQAAAFVNRFNEADRQERAAVAQAQHPGAPVAGNGAAPEMLRDADPTSASSSLAGTASAAASSSSPDNTENSNASSFDAGYDPLASGAEILSSHDDAPQSDSSYLAVDSSGQFWFSSVDSEGMIHWYSHRPDRRFIDERDARRLDGDRDLPDGAVVIRDHQGRWVITYFDAGGRMHRYFRRADELHLEAGAWRIRVDENGRRVAMRDSEESHPRDLRLVQWPSNETDHHFVGGPTSHYPSYGSSPTHTVPGSTAGVSHSSYSGGSYSGGSAGRSYAGSTPAPAPATAGMR